MPKFRGSSVPRQKFPTAHHCAFRGSRDRTEGTDAARSFSMRVSRSDILSVNEMLSVISSFRICIYGFVNRRSGRERARAAQHHHASLFLRSRPFRAELASVLPPTCSGCSVLPTSPPSSPPPCICAQSSVARVHVSPGDLPRLQRSRLDSRP